MRHRDTDFPVSDSFPKSCPQLWLERTKSRSHEFHLDHLPKWQEFKDLSHPLLLPRSVLMGSCNQREAETATQALL